MPTAPGGSRSCARTDDPLTHAYLKALGRRIGVEISVNTSFNVAGPIAQTPQPGDRYAAPLEGPRRGAAGGRRRRGHRGMARRRARQRPVYAAGFRSGSSAAEEAEHAAVDHQQRAADHQRADDLGRRDAFAEREPAEQDRGDGNQQRHQHDIGRAGSPQDLKEHDVGQRRRQRGETEQRQPGRQARHRQLPRPLDHTGDRNHHHRGRQHLERRGRQRRRVPTVFAAHRARTIHS